MKKTLVFLVAISMSVLVTSSLAENQKSAKRKRPINTDFNKAGFKIIKVLRIEKEKNALGKLLERDEKFEVGRALEMSKTLEKQDQGEQYLIRWKYSGKKTYSKIGLKFECKLKNRAGVSSLSKDYENVSRGSYKVMVKNIGQAFSRNGEIEYWKTTIVADGKVVAEKKSLLWDAFGSLRKKQ